MANKIQKFIYFLSAISPILIVFAVVWLIKNSTWEKPISLNWKIPLILILISFVNIFVFYCSFNFAKKHIQILTVTGNGYSCDDSWIIGYILTYLLPLTNFKFGDYIFSIVIVIVVLLFIFLIFTDYITPHPLLYLKKYHFYTFDVDGAASGYHLISRTKIRSAKDVKKVIQIYEFLLLREE